MVVLVALSGAIWAYDALFLAKRRRLSGADVEPSRLVDYARSFFPVFLIVFILRSFLFEPFRIPSNSMMPTLLTGDFILVNKFNYGIRLPVLDMKIVDVGVPARGDVIVFRYPEDPSTPFIKRVVGLPGDEIGYYNKTVYVNGTPMAQEKIGIYTGEGPGAGMTGASHRREMLDENWHDILVQSNSYPSPGGKLTVPSGHYFVLGDNRDNSRDSRYWGTVPDENLIGRAFGIWMHWESQDGFDWPRIGTSIK
jgi:signal peptidase I